MKRFTKAPTESLLDAMPDDVISRTALPRGEFFEFRTRRLPAWFLARAKAERLVLSDNDPSGTKCKGRLVSLEPPPRETRLRFYDS